MDACAELARRAGLLLDQVGRRSLERVDPADPEAIERAAEAIAAPETWFFRDREPFVYLAQFAAAAPRPLRVLSAPCSTGEEPYSIAMTLLDAGLLPDTFQIDAVDISRRAIEAAARGIYGRSSFRHPMPEILENYFCPVSAGFQLLPKVANQVRFIHANLLEFPHPAQPYHAIFCRNLLIYLHDDARRRLIAAMRSLLAEGGVLFAGHCELPLFLEAGLQAAKHPRSFACHNPSRDRKGASVFPSKPLPSVNKPVTPPPLTLQDAKSLADRGLLSEAAEIARRLDPGAGVFCLLGLICQSENRLSEAEEYFRRALHLDPTHAEASMHMTILSGVPR